MNYKNKLSMALLAISSTAFSETKVGLGTDISTLVSYSAQTSTNRIVMPFKTESNLVIEPAILYSKYDFKENEDQFSNDKRSGEGFGFGIGVLKQKSIENNFFHYAGVRLSTFSNITKYTYNYSSSNNSEYKQSTRSNTIAPIVGIGYQIQESIDLSLETSLNYTMQSGDEEGDRVYTGTRFLVRMYF